MSRTNCDEAIKFTLKEEGGYGNDSRDPGGPTNYGITIADVRKYVKPGATAQDVKNLTQAQAISIYRNKYWKTPYYDCDTLAPGVDLAVFDFGVNSGPSRAKKFLDKAVGGPDSETITKLCDARLAFLKGLSTWSTFGKGWGGRVSRVRARALQMSTDALKSIKGSQVRVGLFGAILTSLAAAYHWVFAHPIIVVTGGIVIALVIAEIIHLIRINKNA